LRLALHYAKIFRARVVVPKIYVYYEGHEKGVVVVGSDDLQQLVIEIQSVTKEVMKRDWDSAEATLDGLYTDGRISSRVWSYIEYIPMGLRASLEDAQQLQNIEAREWLNGMLRCAADLYLTNIKQGNLIDSSYLFYELVLRYRLYSIDDPHRIVGKILQRLKPDVVPALGTKASQAAKNLESMGRVSGIHGFLESLACDSESASRMA
jgi:hypothetical protein